MRIKKILPLLFVLIFLVGVKSAVAVEVTAKEDGIGVVNEFSDEDSILVNGLPSEEDLIRLNENNKDVFKESNKTTGGKEIKSGKGELYKAYKSDIDSFEKNQPKGVGKEIKDLTKQYNTATGKLECGTFEFECKINNVVISSGAGLLKASLNPMQKFIIKPSDVLEAPGVTLYKSAFSTLTDVMVVLFFVFQILKILSMRMTNGEGISQGVFEKTVKLIVSVSLIGIYDVLFKIALSVQYLLVSPILASIALDDNSASLVVLKSMLLGGGTSIVIMLVVLAIVYVAVILALFYRLALLIILYITGPIAIATMVNDELEFFSLWLRKLIGGIVTLLLQSLCIAMSISTTFRLSFNEFENMTDLCLSLAFLFLALGIPKLLENFGNSSGSGRTTLIMARSGLGQISRLKS